MVYSGRAHFFRRFKIRGARHVIFYSLPEYPHFYPEIVNMLGADTGGNNDSNNVSQVDMGEESSCLTMFTDYEKMALERVVGHKRAEHIFDSDKSTFLFF